MFGVIFSISLAVFRGGLQIASSRIGRQLYRELSPWALSDSFEYLCYGSTTIRNMFTLIVRGSTLDVRNRRLQTSDSDD